MGVPAPTELLLILAIVLLVFGSKRIPEIMSGFGQGIKEFKKILSRMSRQNRFSMRKQISNHRLKKM